jgi:hypothetical protein
MLPLNICQGDPGKFVPNLFRQNRAHIRLFERRVNRHYTDFLPNSRAVKARNRWVRILGLHLPALLLREKAGLPPLGIGDGDEHLFLPVGQFDGDRLWKTYIAAKAFLSFTARQIGDPRLNQG